MCVYIYRERAIVCFIYETLFTLAAITKLWKAAITFVMFLCLSVRPSVRPEQFDSHWTDLHDI